MYNDYFQFKREPFSIAPDPRFLYLSEVHREAFAHLMYGFANSGFVLITGEVGTGKTTLLRNLIGQTPPDLDVAFILNPRLTVKELLETICDELGIQHSESSAYTVKQYIDLLNKHLLRSHREGRSTVMIIDEAQNLTPAVLEQIRLLTNLETDERKLLRIILLGQPELGKLLEREELRQLSQRITARYHLASLGKEDSFAYVRHRLTTVGGNPHIFDKGALRKLYRISKGVPRIINVLADRSLLGAYVEGKQSVSSAIVKRAAHEVLGNRFSLIIRQRYPLWLAACVVAVTAVSMAWAYFSDPPVESTPGLTSETIAQAGAAVQAETITRTQAIALDTQDTAVQTLDRSILAQETDQATNAPAKIPEPRGSDPTDGFPEEEQSTSSDLVSRGLADLPEAVRIERPPEGSYSTQRKAYAAVFARWGARYIPEENSIPCDFAPSVGLQCLSLNGSWSEISQLNLPVILELRDAQAVPYYAAVTATETDGRSFQFNLGDEVYRITPNDLRDTWYGRYVVLWKMPPDYHGSLRNGDDHPSVGWLRGQLQNLVESPLRSATPNRFDDGLRDAVLTFQRAEGLLADGIVGPETWIRLTDRLQLPRPKLNS